MLNLESAKKSAKKCSSKWSQVLINFISKACPSALRKEQWAASSPFVKQHTHVFYQKNFNENFIFKWSVRGTANLLVTILPSKKLFNGSNGYFLSWSILHKMLQRHIWNPLIHPRWSFCEKKITSLSIFTKKLSVRLGSKYAAFRESLRKCNF